MGGKSTRREKTSWTLYDDRGLQDKSRIVRRVRPHYIKSDSLSDIIVVIESRRPSPTSKVYSLGGVVKSEGD